MHQVVLYAKLKNFCMKLYLTRQHDGSYMLTAFRPIVTRVRGTSFDDVYLRHGEPIGIRHLCAGGVKSLFNVELQLLETVRVDLTSVTISDQEPEG